MSYSYGDDSRPPDTPSSGGADYSSARKAYEKDSSGTSSRSSSRRSSKESRRDHDFSSARDETPHPIDRKPSVAVRTESTHPIVVCADDTGSFINEIKVILEKLPLLSNEVVRYLPEAEICFALIGDTTSDHQPIQVRDFGQGEILDEHLKKLFPEGGGGDDPESYDLAAYYFSNHCEMPNATKPIFIWVLDSNTRSTLEAESVKRYIGDNLQSDLNSREVLKKLNEKFVVYVILKGRGDWDFWSKIVGDQRIVPFEDARDIIELMIGIIAGEAGRFDDFAKVSSVRHSDRPDRISRVTKSLRSVKETSERAGSTDGTSSTAHRPDGKSLRSKKLV